MDLFESAAGSAVGPGTPLAEILRPKKLEDILGQKKYLAPGTAIRRWGHVRMFSPWRYTIDTAAQQMLEGTGWLPEPLRTLYRPRSGSADPGEAQSAANGGEPAMGDAAPLPQDDGLS